MKRIVTIDTLKLDLRGTDRATAERAVALLGPTLARQLATAAGPAIAPHSPAQALADRLAAGLLPTLRAAGSPAAAVRPRPVEAPVVPTRAAARPGFTVHTEEP